jgi:hypothetical protein
MLASVVLAALLTGTASPAPAAIVTTSNSAVLPQPSAKALAPVVINGVLFRAVEFDTGKALWRNLAITVTPDHIETWRALPAPIKYGYAEQMVGTYRAGLRFSRDIKLTFVDETNATLDQYLWTSPRAERQ